MDPPPVNFSPLTFLTVPSSTNIGETTGKNISPPDLTHEPPSLMAAKADAPAAMPFRSVGRPPRGNFVMASSTVAARPFVCVRPRPYLRSFERSFHCQASIKVYTVQVPGINCSMMETFRSIGLGQR